MIPRKVPIEVSARHVHLSLEHFKYLFGAASQLTVHKAISQPNQFAARETVTVVGPKGQMRLRIVGPVRDYTQIEISASDSRYLGLPVECRLSGDIKGTPGCVLIGPAGKLELKEGVIVAHRHLHISPAQAKAWGLQHNQRVSIRVESIRPLTFHDVYVKSRPGYDELSFMIDTDEANAVGIFDSGTAVKYHGTIIEN